jgi:hypothetical protein
MGAKNNCQEIRTSVGRFSGEALQGLSIHEGNYTIKIIYVARSRVQFTRTSLLQRLRYCSRKQKQKQPALVTGQTKNQTNPTIQCLKKYYCITEKITLTQSRADERVM